MFLDRKSPPHIFTLVLATATSALSMNVILPSLPGIAAHFQAEYSLVQLTVSLYLIGTAVLQLAIGPASDRFGRRKVMLACFALFIAGSVATLFAPTIEFLLAARLLQAFSAAGMVLSRAIVRDTVDANEAASQIGYITMGMAVVPMIAPAIGGILDEVYGWQAAFILMLVFGIVSFGIVFFDLGETNANKSASMIAQIRTYPQLLKSRLFWGYTLTAAFTSGAFFAFLGGGPYVATQILHLGPADYGLYFAIVSIGYMIGNFIAARQSRRFGIVTMMFSGNIFTCLGVGVSIALFAMGVYHPLSLFVPVALMGLGNGMTMPNANAGAISVKPHLAGSASGLTGAIQIGGGAILALVAGAAVASTTGPEPLLYVMLASALGALVSTLLIIRAAKQKQTDGTL